MSYTPHPLDTTAVAPPAELLQLTELLAEHAHDVWARQRLAEGWRYGPRRDDARKEHPSLVPYEELPESEKDYDRSAALETIKAILSLGYEVVPPRRADLRRAGSTDLQPTAGRHARGAQR